MNETAPQTERPTNGKKSQPRLQVIAFGNPFRGDDSAGLEIDRRLGARPDYSCPLRPQPQSIVELLDLFAEAEVILFVDAVTSGAVPGTLHLLSLPIAGLEPRGLSALSGHGWGVAETLELARALGCPIPRIVLLGVEIGSVSLGAPRSPLVEQAIALVVERFPRLRALLLDTQANDARRPRRFLPGDTSFPGV